MYIELFLQSNAEFLNVIMYTTIKNNIKILDNDHFQVH